MYVSIFSGAKLLCLVGCARGAFRRRPPSPACSTLPAAHREGSGSGSPSMRLFSRGRVLLLALWSAALSSSSGLGLQYGRKLEDGQTDLISSVLGNSASGKALGAARDIDVEEFVEGLPTPFRGSGLVNLAYVDAGLKHMEIPDKGVDLVSVLRAGKAQTGHESPEVLAERGRRLLMASDPKIRSLYTSEGDAAVSEEDINLLLYHMSRSLSNAEITPTEKLMQLGPQFYPNPLLELGLADLAIEVMAHKQDGSSSSSSRRSGVGDKLAQLSYRMPLLSSNSLLRVGLEHRDSLGPQDLMKRGYRVLEELSDASKVALKLENLTTLRPNSASLAATLRAISRGLPAYNLGTASSLARIIDAGSTLGPDTLDAPAARKLLWWGGAGQQDPDELTWQEREQLADLAYALVGLQTVPKQRGPQGDITTDELIGIGRARADGFTYMDLVQMGQQSMGVLGEGTRASLAHQAKVLQTTDAGLVTSLLARAASEQPPDAPVLASTPLDRLVAEGLNKLQQQQQQGSDEGSRPPPSPQDLLKLGLLQLGLSAAKNMATTAVSINDLVNLGALHQEGQAADLIGLGSALLDRVVADYGARAADPAEVMGAVAAALEQGGGSLRLSSLDALDLVRVGNAALQGDKLRMAHANTAVEVLQEDPQNYRSHAEGPIVFQ